ncbi:MAG: polysaccharide deacetylase family protein [Peptostreptococcaceae bacterium]
MKSIIKILAILVMIISIILFIKEFNKNTNIAENNLEIPVLMYHHFDEYNENTSSETVYKEEFREQMKYLNENGYTAITTKDIFDYKNGSKQVPNKPILITADDGYLSNYEIMYPILKENNLKATIFLIGDRIDNARTSNIGIPKIDWLQAKEMYNSGVIDFQSHTYNSHDIVETRDGQKGNFSSALINESEEEYKKRIDEDIKLSIDGFEKNLGYKPIAFAYPFGQFSNISEEVLKSNNIKISFTVKDGFILLDKGTYLLNRINVAKKDSIQTFINKIKNNK